MDFAVGGGFFAVGGGFFAVGAAGARPAERLRQRWILPPLLLLPEQPNACGNGGFAAAAGFVSRLLIACFFVPRGTSVPTVPVPVPV